MNLNIKIIDKNFYNINPVFVSLLDNKRVFFRDISVDKKNVKYMSMVGSDYAVELCALKKRYIHYKTGLMCNNNSYNGLLYGKWRLRHSAMFIVPWA